uniref:5-oxoprolinase subunit B family protein n=1 Tax=Thaumasiovibrio occultus TaxID=1891184 RepID=UPI000B3580C9|nr:carboxyltransferase domain-containing protein [Thaumasiovibrio occultus]
MMNVSFVGENSLLFRFADDIDLSLPPKIALLANALTDQFGESLRDLTPSYTTLLVEFQPMQDPAAIIQFANSVSLLPKDTANTADIVAVPACYDQHVAPDLLATATALKLNVDTLIERHANQVYTVAAIGFLPGFPFMASLDASLILPRKTSPVIVPAGSVAIAESQTAIYPCQSPGGWHVIARCPQPLFNHQDPRLSLLKPGDRVRFTPISYDEYRLQEQHYTIHGENDA